MATKKTTEASFWLKCLVPGPHVVPAFPEANIERKTYETGDPMHAPDAATAKAWIKAGHAEAVPIQDTPEAPAGVEGAEGA